MTKEDWEKIRGKSISEIPMQVWFEYYKDNINKPRTYADFIIAFQEMASRSEMIVQGLDGSMKRITAESALRRLNEYYDGRFNL